MMDQNASRKKPIQIGYVVDSYSPYSKNDDVCFIFHFNDYQWCIRRVQVIDNLPVLDLSIDDTTDLSCFHIHKSFREAFDYAMRLKELNR